MVWCRRWWQTPTTGRTPTSAVDWSGEPGDGTQFSDGRPRSERAQNRVVRTASELPRGVAATTLLAQLGGKRGVEAYGVALSTARAPIERSIARLKSWRVFQKTRCSPNRMTITAAAVLILERQHCKRSLLHPRPQTVEVDKAGRRVLAGGGVKCGGTVPLVAVTRWPPPAGPGPGGGGGA
jgi:hypothetical protein